MKLGITQKLVVLHRWLGVVLCLFIAGWFVSGIILIYVPFPSLAVAERIANRTDVPLNEIGVSPATVTAGIESAADSFRLIARSGRPLYVIHSREKAAVAIWADSGSLATVSGVDDARSIAREFSDVPIRLVEGPIDFDQWVVHQSFDDQRPFYKVLLDDEAGTELYVSQRSGEVVQRTRRVERTWNYFGAVVHWIYPTVLRRHWAVWDQVVWWLSLVGVIVSVFGIWLGIDRMRLAMRANKGSIFLYRGWMRWHHILGVFAGLFVLTWMLSGWLSMDHGRLMSIPDPQPSQIDRFRGISISTAAASMDIGFIQSLGNFRELKVNAVAGTPYAVTNTGGETRIYSPVESRLNDLAVLPESIIVDAARRAWSTNDVVSVQGVDANDTYTRLRNSRLPESALRLTLDDESSTWVHVDSASGQIISIMDRSRRLNRWLFNGLHSLDFPGLTQSKLLWNLLIVSLLCLGLAFSITGVYLGYRRARRKLQS